MRLPLAGTHRPVGKLRICRRLLNLMNFMIEPVAELPALLAARKAARGLIVKLADALEQAALRRFDGILVLKDGRIAESGSFDELMEQKGYFYALYTVSQ